MQFLFLIELNFLLNINEKTKTMATFLVLTSSDYDHQEVMEIARKNSMMYNNHFGGPGFCDTEIIASWNDYKIFEEAIANGVFKSPVELRAESDEISN